MTSPSGRSIATPSLSSPFIPDHTTRSPNHSPNEQGMVAGGEWLTATSRHHREGRIRKRRRGKRPPITYLSRHFSNDVLEEPARNAESVKAEEKPMVTLRSTPGATVARIYHGLNIDDLSSDSSLTDVPEDIGPDPFHSEAAPAAGKVQARLKSKRPTKSPYFPHRHKHRPTFLSTLPFPPLSAPTFGLMQERLSHDPFRLLIATIFLNKTPGERAMPVFYQLMERYPTPTDLAKAEVSDVTAIIYQLGFQNQRARKCVSMAKMWLLRPPEKGKRTRKLNYPGKGDGRDLKSDEVIDDEDARVAWEISHLPGLGPYSHDSWRMFCRDGLRGVASSGYGPVAEGASLEPEWKRVVPEDKELRAYLTWMWLKEGWVWNKETGERTKASEELMDMAQGGGIVVEEKNTQHLIVKPFDGGKVDLMKQDKVVERLAGQFIPETWLN